MGDEGGIRLGNLKFRLIVDIILIGGFQVDPSICGWIVASIWVDRGRLDLPCE